MFPFFGGNPVDYRSFIRAFESFIESRTCNSTERPYYLEQYTTRDVKELIKSCHHLPPDAAYEEARKLLKKWFGDEYRVASAYESKALAWPPIRMARPSTNLLSFYRVARMPWREVSMLRNLTSQGTFRNE